MCKEIFKNEEIYCAMILSQGTVHMIWENQIKMREAMTVACLHSSLDSHSSGYEQGRGRLPVLSLPPISCFLDLDP